MKFTLPDWINDITAETALKLLLYWIFGGSAPTPGGGLPVTPGGGTVRTFSLTAAVGNGSVTAGAKSVAFSSSSDFSGTIAGAAFGASQTTGASVDGADTIGVIAYTRSAGTLYIATLT